MTTLLLADDDCEQGGKNGSDDIENDFAYKNNVLQANKEIRLGFIRKVYSLLTLQLLTTVIIGAVFSTVEPVKLFIHQNDWMILVAFISSIAILVALYVKRRETPTNLILLAAFTVVQAYTIGVLVSYYEQRIVLQAVFLTLAVVAGITLFTFNTKRDFSSMHSALFAGLCVLLVGGILQIFIQNTAFEFIISIGGALVFSLFIVYDTQMLMKTLSPEEYILATINLYMDILNLFLYILRILQAANRN
ncbi:protein lifeguard 4-like [Arctopsyche grandis]|uniref:protein lifeguard 4-like n=1 Tax=Arctopsyche grandis TaxID=121162 RepID=UPI00406D71E9